MSESETPRDVPIQHFVEWYITRRAGPAIAILVTSLVLLALAAPDLQTMQVYWTFITGTVFGALLWEAIRYPPREAMNV